MSSLCRLQEPLHWSDLSYDTMDLPYNNRISYDIFTTKINTKNIIPII